MNIVQLDSLRGKDGPAVLGKIQSVLPGGASPAATFSLAPFLRLRRELADCLVPVRPRPEFRAALYRDLVEAAHRQHTRQALALTPHNADPWSDLQEQAGEWLSDAVNRRWIVGAAVGSAVSLAGLVAFVLRQRGRKVA